MVGTVAAAAPEQGGCVGCNQSSAVHWRGTPATREGFWEPRRKGKTSEINILFNPVHLYITLSFNM